VADERARLLSNEVRSGIVRYVALSLGTKDNRLALAPQLTVPLMPALQAAFNLLER
jgi:aryl-alcohol dehydrogenase-like predicted oxidoreductase